ncbi:phosphoribosylanthranilate isomerase [uncultured Moraxella sp.]|uniref:phosphoribosylanthranilate isomerase n=1 Tax=uncultured Moraxella sp. TaxID=263769 RepID=UPI0025FD8057|nr:phosphoribosylanthranilate isomerase [uncultured Moraxella sp.]
MKKIKYCGLTRSEDIQQAVALGVDAIGLVFYPPSPRAVSVEQASQLVVHIPAFVSTVALVVNISDDELVKIAKSVVFDVIQFHGDESPDECRRQAKLINKRWIKALRIDATRHTPASITSLIAEYQTAGASSILLDAYHADKFGGTGERFDWLLIPADSPLPIILAGGLTPDNVAMTANLPIYALDVSGGIESDKGIKDADMMAAFMRYACGN